MNVNERNYGIDALRIVSMLMVVVLHIQQFGTVVYSQELSGLRYLEAWTFQAACVTAVNCFALISGFVCVTRKIKLSSIMMQWLQVAFYSASLVIVVELVAPDLVNMSSWKTGLTPVLHRKYWYYSMYFLLCPMMPMLNEMLRNASGETIRNGLTAALSIVVILTSIADTDVFQFAGGFSLAWIALMYVTGGYLRLHGSEDRIFVIMHRYGLWVFAFCAVLTGGIQGLNAAEIGFPFGLKLNVEYDLYGYMSPLIVLESLALFGWFAAWRPGKKCRALIVRLAPAAFGVYLIHMHPNVCDVFISNRFGFLLNVPVVAFPFVLIGTAMMIYAICTAIEIIRAKAFEIMRVGRICRMIEDVVAVRVGRITEKGVESK